MFLNNDFRLSSDAVASSLESHLRFSKNWLIESTYEPARLAVARSGEAVNKIDIAAIVNSPSSSSSTSEVAFAVELLPDWSAVSVSVVSVSAGSESVPSSPLVYSSSSSRSELSVDASSSSSCFGTLK